MKTLYVQSGYSMFDIDFENQDVNQHPDSRNAVSRVTLLTEDCIVKNKTEQKEAKAGDIVVVFYEESFPHKFVVISSEEWKENIEKYEEHQNENKVKKCSECDDCAGCEKCIND